MEKEAVVSGGDNLNGKSRRPAEEEDVSASELAHNKMLASTGTNISQGNFNKAWGRVYGNNQYKPSWLKNGKAGFLPPPKALYSTKPAAVKELAKEETKTTAPASTIATPPQTASSVRSLTPKPPKAARHSERPIYHQVSRLKINGRVLPRETELDVWKKRIELDEVDADGRRVYNKVVKNTNVPQWLKGNNYWEPKLQRAGRPLKPVLPADRKPKKMRPIPMAKYDLAKYENSVTRPNLVIGKEEVPKERDLHRWSKKIDIPHRVDDRDYAVDRSRAVAAAGGEEVSSSSGRRNWRRILNTSLPRFFTVNDYWH